MIPPNPVPVSILRHRPFALYWIARTSAALGFQMLGVAVAWQMYELTGSAFDLGLVGLVQFLPAAVFMLVAGQIADRYDRRPHRCRSARWSRAWPPPRWRSARSPAGPARNYMLAAVFVFGVGRAHSRRRPSRPCWPSSYRRRCFRARSRRRPPRTQLATIYRPGDRRLALRLRRDGAVYDLLRSLLHVGRPAGIPAYRAAPASARAPINLAAFFAGISYIRHNPIVLGVISLDLFAVLLGGTTALLPIFADDVFHTGPEGLGLLRAAPASAR